MKNVFKLKTDKIFLVILTWFISLFFTITNIFAAMNPSLSAKNTFNIWGDGIQTTFNDAGYQVVLSVDGSEVKVPSSEYSYDGVSIQISLPLISNRNYVKMNYTVTNNSSSPKIIGIATHADIQIGNDDYAPIKNLSGNRGFVMSNGANQFTFIGRDSYGATNVDTYWFGDYNIRENNMWNQSYSYVYGSGSREGDSGMAFSWKDRALAAGQSITYSALIGVGTLNNPPTLSVTNSLKNQYYPGEVVNIQGQVNDIDTGDVVSVKFAVDGGTEQLVGSGYRPNGSPVNYNLNFTVPNNLSVGNHSMQIWAADDKGNMSIPKTVNFKVVHDTTPPTGSHSLNPTGWTKDNVIINVSATDSESGVKRIKLPNNSYVNSANASYTATSNGTYNFVLEDNRGNVRTYPVTISNIDRTAPTGTHSLSNSNWTNQNVTINVSGSDSQSNMKRIKKPDNNYTNGSSTSYVVSANGTYNFVLEDNVGNVRTYPVVITNIDKTNPTGSFTINNGATETNDRNVSLKFTFSDGNGSGVNKIKVTDGTTTKEYNVTTSPFTTTWQVTPAAGRKNFTVTFYDKAGNVHTTSNSIIYTNLEVQSLVLTNVVNPKVFNDKTPFVPKTWTFSPQPMSAGGNISFRIGLSAPVDLPNYTDTVNYKVRLTHSNGYNVTLNGNMANVGGLNHSAKVTIPKDVPKGTKVELLITATRQTPEFTETVYYPSKQSNTTYAYIGNVNNDINEEIRFNEIN